jgi:geranylgeranyl diphosphate synthase type I
MTTRSQTAALRSEMLAAIEEQLRAAATPLTHGPQAEMGEMVSFHFGWDGAERHAGGKRIRPLLTTLCCSAAGGSWQQAIPAAAAVELIHNFSLIHDDIEDGSRTRRGRPTLWTRWDLPQALNTGDALLILSQSTAQALDGQGVDAARVLAVLTALNDACLQLTIGQHLDLAFETRRSVSLDEYLVMIRGKTASLTAAAAAAGAIVGGCDQHGIDGFRGFGHHLGMAFQIQDDILGIWGVPDRTGKPAGDDLLSRKKTLPVLLGLSESQGFRELWAESPQARQDLDPMRRALEAAGVLKRCRQMAEEHTQQALARLADADPNGEAVGELRTLAEGLLDRDS